jgi:Tol biopolymer transport system component/tRNA A-37 threonylcarbamoyl transferase component Bud32
MTLAPGTKIGRYEIRAQLGAGGMGEVYLAQDSKLGRTVALKILPNDLSSDQSRMKRFVQEARTASSLNHPNILTIYEIEEVDSTHLIATEFIDGETLRERINRDHLPITRALEIAIQVASALAAAHEAGIVHRDLKPENIMLRRRDDIVKLLDFGIAKLTEPGPSAIDTEAATRALVNTAPGTMLGTVSYMSPEQARGLEVDARTDIWSLGVVLYEIISGRLPFEGSTASDVLVAILEKEPAPLARYSKEAPEALEWMITKALRKDRQERYQTTRELLSDLRTLKHQLEFQEELQRTGTGIQVQDKTTKQTASVLTSKSMASPGQHSYVKWLLASLLVIGLAAAVFLLLRKSNEQTVIATLPKLSQLTFAEGIEQYPAWSPDGRQLAFSGEVGGVRKIFLKRLETGEETQLTRGPNDDIQPAWSPDSQTIIFARSRQAREKLQPGDVFGAFEGGDIWSINVLNAKEDKTIDNAFNPAYSPDGKMIAFDASWVGPHRIWIADSQGHNAQQVSSDTSEDVNHVRPRWSPDGSHIVFQNIERTKFNVRVADVAQRKLAWVTNDLFNNLNPVWSQSGNFIYFSSDRGGGYNVWRVRVSPESALAGSPQQLTTGAGQDVELAISSDGKRMALSILKQNADVWKLPVSPETGKPSGPPQEVITTTREDSRASWSPDGTMIAFNSDRSGEMNIWLYSHAGCLTRQLTKGPGGDFQANWAPNGKRIVFFSSRGGNADIWSADVETGSLQQLTHGSSIDINPFFSPDGKYIAYQSDQTGRPEVWVMNADGSAARQLTRVGVRGHFLRWNKNGDAIIFRCPFGDKPRTMQASLDGADPQILPDVSGGSHMSLSPDYSFIMDVVGHKTLWVSPLVSGKPEKVFEFSDPDVRIDYPVWSPDGKWVLFDRFRPQGGDIWMMENFE